MNAGLPVVATDVGDNARLVRNGVNGQLTPVGDERALVVALLELIRSPALRARYGAESRRILEQGHSFGAFQRAYEALLAAAFEDGRGSAPGR